MQRRRHKVSVASSATSDRVGDPLSTASSSSPGVLERSLARHAGLCAVVTLAELRPTSCKP